jgi:hypothetical protein
VGQVFTFGHPDLPVGKSQQSQQIKLTRKILPSQKSFGSNVFWSQAMPEMKLSDKKGSESGNEDSKDSSSVEDTSTRFHTRSRNNWQASPNMLRRIQTVEMFAQFVLIQKGNVYSDGLLADVVDTQADTTGLCQETDP